MGRVSQIGLHAIALSLATTACTASPQLLVELVGSVPADAETLTITTCDSAGDVVTVRSAPVLGLSLPHVVPVSPLHGDTSRVFLFTATVQGADGGTLVTARAVRSFPASGRASTTLPLDASCSTPCDSLETCNGGRCVSAVDVGRALSDAERAGLSRCGGETRMDAGVDAAALDAAALDAPDARQSCDVSRITEMCPTSSPLESCLPAGCAIAFGSHDVVGLTQTRVPTSRQRVNRYELVREARIRGFYLHLRNDAAWSQPFRVVLYSDSAGTPRLRGLVSRDTTLSADGAVDAWFWLPLDDVATVGPGALWMGFTSGAGTGAEAAYVSSPAAASSVRVGDLPDGFEGGSPIEWVPCPVTVCATESRQTFQLVAIGDADP